MKKSLPPPFRFQNPRTDDEMLAQLAAHLGMLMLELKTEKKWNRAMERLEAEELPAALVAIRKPVFIAGQVLGQAMNLFAAFVAKQFGADPPSCWGEPSE